MTLRKLIFQLLSAKPMNIGELLTEIQIKNPDIARPTVRGRLSDMVKAKEIQKVGSERNSDSQSLFKVIPLSVQAENRPPQIAPEIPITQTAY